MLVLRRTPNEEIKIEAAPGVWITVKVISVRGVRVQLGVDAPEEMRIMRRELFDREAA